MKFQTFYDTDWDYIIILDACRYDYFKEHYHKYLPKGKLEPRRSRGSCTTEWAHKTFKQPMPNVTYISTNPFINNKNLNLKELTIDCNKPWCATTTFKKVIDLWLTHWDNKLGTVHPANVNVIVKKMLPHKKLIIHYVQPHEPYLAYKAMGKEWIARNKVKRKLWHPFALLVWKYLSFKQRVRIKKLLGARMSVFENFYARGEINKLKMLYEENLIIVLAYIGELIKDLNGTIVVTADHAECFGEGGVWGHPCNSKNRFLRTVPWLVIKK